MPANKTTNAQNVASPPEQNTGLIFKWLNNQNIECKSLGFDSQGVEILEISPENLLSVCIPLYSLGCNYLRCLAAYDNAPGGSLVSVYYLVKVSNSTRQPEEVCLKVFLPRKNPSVPSVYWIWKTADFQERENFDLYGIIYEGHPHLKRILMPESWVGWPLRKDYITPEFFELQNAQ
jgi:NAD(P)H-quinone oxidoreductase subunit J